MTVATIPAHPEHLTLEEYLGLKELGRRLEAHRLRCGLSRALVCQTIGCSMRGLKNWEDGDRTINFIHFVRLCRLYGISPDEFRDVIPQPWEVLRDQDSPRTAAGS